MATLIHRTNDIPKELWVVRDGKRNRVFWFVHTAKRFYDTLDKDDTISIIKYKRD